MDRLLTRIRVFLLPWIRFARSESSPFIRHFSCKELRRATGSFSTIMGNGSHGVVYKAQFSDGLVAVVREVRDFQQGQDAFDREVQLLARLHHRHLVTLRGFSKGYDRFLVFDYMENGSLKELLHDPLKTPLNWRRRLQIAVDVAAALDYLHSFCDPAVFQVSVNSSNVLLDENFAAKLSDVGFLASEGDLILKVNATCSGHIDQKFKHVVFQYGVLLLELVTGQSFGNEDMDLVKWVQESAFTDSIHKMVDTDLGNSYDSKEVKSLLVIARLCTKNEGTGSITIKQVLRYLQRTLEPFVPFANYC
eukprot:TRINITY_DN5033_c0_g1_i1.p1 TRINITY_DN5033_c0_g1~~TRINITY_DN5033_c0_g1_i1.p1  ORF type:complete len:306 (+),score=53.09 TRINITY_DN5033_c0_g1_i1:192-1109(+)